MTSGNVEYSGIFLRGPLREHFRSNLGLFKSEWLRSTLLLSYNGYAIRLLICPLYWEINDTYACLSYKCRVNLLPHTFNDANTYLVLLAQVVRLNALLPLDIPSLFVFIFFSSHFSALTKRSAASRDETDKHHFVYDIFSRACAQNKKYWDRRLTRNCYHGVDQA